MRPWRSSLLAAVCALALYLPLRSIHFGINGIGEARAIEAGGAALVHPNHLLYRPLGFAVTAGLQRLELAHRAIGPLQVISAVCGALFVGAALCAYLAAGAGSWSATLAAALLATACAPWRFSTDAHYITVAALATGGATAWLFAGSGSLAAAAGVGFCYAFAVLGWQGNVFLAPMLLLGVLRHPRAVRPRAAAAVCAVTAGGILVAAYTVAGILGGRVHGARDLVAWSSSYGGATLPIWGVWARERLRIAGTTWVASIIPLFEGLGLRDALRGRWTPGKLLGQLALVSLVVLLATTVAGGLAPARIDRARRRTALWMLGAFVSYLPFIIWWDPYEPKWFVVPDLFLFGAAALVWSDTQRGARALLISAVLVIAAANFAYTIWPNHSTQNPQMARARCIAEHAGSTDVLVVADWDWLEYALYFFQYRGETLFLINRRPREDKLGEIGRAIADARGRGGHAYLVDPREYDSDRSQWLTVQTGLSVDDFGRLAPRSAFRCDDVGVVELMGQPALAHEPDWNPR